MQNKIELILDIECYIDYFLAKFRRRDDRTVFAEFELFDGVRLNVTRIKELIAKRRIITFNGNNYDIPMLTLALAGANNKQLKMASDRIIQQQLKSWQFYKRYDLRELQIDHIDLIEPAPGVRIGLKMYGARLHSRRLQDLPIIPSAHITPEQRPLMRSYCGNDLDTTCDLADAIQDRIDLRTALGQRYGMDFRSKSDAQIGEAILRKMCEENAGCKIEKPDTEDRTFRYTPPKFIKFKTPEMQAVFERMCAAEYALIKGEAVMPKSIEGYVMHFRGKKYKLGIGGLHSQESKIHNKADAAFEIWDYDVASYYPNIILLCELFPLHIGRHFLKAYRELVEMRLKAKRSGDKVMNEGLKISINGSYGKFGSKYSVLFSPELMIQVTVTGQLGLLMLVERMEEAGIEVISANTDGIVMRPHVSDTDALHDVIRQWCAETGFEMEGTQYSQVLSRDVNNYVAIKTGHETATYKIDSRTCGTNYSFSEKSRGGIKTKGVFETSGIRKNPVAQISIDAAINYLIHRKPISHTIRACKDIRKFLVVRTVASGGIWKGEYLGKTVRWVYAKDGAPIVTKKKGDKVATSDGAWPMMALPVGYSLDAYVFDGLQIDFMKYCDLSRNLLIKAGFKFIGEEL